MSWKDGDGLGFHFLVIVKHRVAVIIPGLDLPLLPENYRDSLFAFSDMTAKAVGPFAGQEPRFGESAKV